jgi:nitrate reductase alpha subunit
MGDARQFSSTRREFFRLTELAGCHDLTVPEAVFAGLRFLEPAGVENPLAAYPNRDWQRI